ncbi:ATP-binding protein [Saliniramus sp.]|uniref:PAS domain-containing sensor histidine kinase n=1 Tax=Saliniramus sp. TaxID=2986772 RepID=UPI002B90AFD3|nr:ATP-binding protein [Saliniramus sp.]HMB12317.1 ATP-binding protein [Saliniramus sp.]
MTFEEIDKAIATMASDADLAPLLGSRVPALVFAADPLRLLWSSQYTNALACAIVIAPDGRIDPAFPAARRIEALARSEAPMTGKRFEKIRFETSTLAPLTTCAFRRITMPDSSTALILTFIDRLPQIRRPASAGPAQAQISEPGGQDSQSASVEAVEAQAPEPITGPVRFLWECDAGGVITRISGDLARAVGAPHADLVGRSLSAILDTTTPDALAHDPKEMVLDLIARRETFSGRRIFWKAQGETAIAVDFAGFPAPGAAGRAGAYRGFGIARPEISCAWASLVRQGQDHPAKENDAPQQQPAGAIAEPSDPGPLASLVPQPGAKPEATPETQAATVPVPPTQPAPEPEPAAGAAMPDAPASAHAPVAAPTTAPPTTAPDQVLPLTPVSVTAAFGAATFDITALGQQGAADAMAGFATRIGGRLGDGETPLRIVGEAETTTATPPARKIADREIVDQQTVIGKDAVAGDGTVEEVAVEQMAVEEDGAETAAAPEPAAPAPATPQTAEADSAQPDVLAPDTVQTQPPGPAPLSSEERNAFREIAKALGARFGDDGSPAIHEADDTHGGASGEENEDAPEAPAPDDAAAAGTGGSRGAGSAPVIITAANDRTPDIRTVLDRLPAGVVVHRGEEALFINRYLLDLLGYADLASFVEAGGLARLFRARPAALSEAAQESTAPLIIANRNGESVAVEVRLTMIDWLGYPASMLMLRKIAETDPVERLRALETDLAAREERLREQTAILDTATDGVVLLDQGGRILSLNRAAEALFGYDQREIAGESLTQLLETESHVSALEYLASMREDALRSVLNDGCEVLGRVRQGGAIPLFMTLGSLGEGLDRKFCAVLRDMTAFKQTENELIAARRTAEAASAQKSEFLARISHEVRTPLNAIIGFAEVMLDERFGPVGNERYRDYLTDIHASGEHVISLVNDLLDLAKIEAGRMELNFIPVALNDLVNAGVAMMQPEAARERIVLRSSFADSLPPVLVDERAMRQIVINLLSNAVKFTDPGGQVIVSTARGSEGDIIFRVRDTGIGMNEGEVTAALEPFRQLATARKAGGTGLGLPLTKALVEANQGNLRITSRKNEGTLAEVVFPPARVVTG